MIAGILKTQDEVSINPYLYHMTNDQTKFNNKRGTKQGMSLHHVLFFIPINTNY